MYKDFYGFQIKPFNVTPDPRFLYRSGKHMEGLAQLRYAVDSRKGFAVLTGEVGVGKTTVVKALFESLPPEVRTVLLFNPRLSAVQLLSYIVRDLGIETRARSKIDLLSELNAFLLDRAIEGGTAVVVIDESQNLTPSLLEEIRMLSNLETSEEKLIQIVLSGQPQLADLLRKDRLRQVVQRIFLWHHIDPLSDSETGEYILHRLKIAGHASGGELFPSETRLVAYELSGGIPRIVNLVCDAALVEGFVDGRRTISSDTMIRAAQTLQHVVSLEKYAQNDSETRMSLGVTE
jgi:general secretion pathway protein A